MDDQHIDPYAAVPPERVPPQPMPAYPIPPQPMTSEPMTSEPVPGRPESGVSRRVVVGMAAAVAIAVAGGLAVNAATSSSTTTSTSVLNPPAAAVQAPPWYDPSTPNQNPSTPNQNPSTPNQNPSTPGQAADAGAGTATAKESVGVVDINTVLGYQGSAAAGTGMVLTSNGEILTNNHVVDGATKITVTVVSTGASYSATVVGTDPTDDVAVLKLQDASGLQTVHTSASAASVGDAITAVGNAGGTGGTPSAATGSVVATGQTITASDESGANAESLTGMLQIDANVQAGDSGGPLYNSAGDVVGIDTAASSNAISTTNEAYAIPIGKALGIANQIESGNTSSTIHLGYPAFLGISLSNGSDGATSSAGATVSEALDGGPAATAGISAGDVITALDGHQVSSSTDLSTLLAGDHPGQRVSVSWTDSTGAAQTATVTLATGPAD